MQETLRRKFWMKGREENCFYLSGALDPLFLEGLGRAGAAKSSCLFGW